MRSISKMSGSSSTTRMRAIALADEVDVAVAVGDLADLDGAMSVGAEVVDGLVAVHRGHRDHHADPEVEDLRHLVVGDRADALDLSEDARDLPLPAAHDGIDVRAEHARQVALDAAARDVGDG